MPESSPEESRSGILQSLRNLAATLVALLRTRLDLVVTELEEERLRLLTLGCWAVGAIFFLGIGVLLLVFLVIAAYWDTHRLAAIGSLAALFLVVGAGMAFAVRKRMHRSQKLLSASLEELAKDSERLKRP